MSNSYSSIGEYLDDHVGFTSSTSNLHGGDDTYNEFVKNHSKITIPSDLTSTVRPSDGLLFAPMIEQHIEAKQYLDTYPKYQRIADIAMYELDKSKGKISLAQAMRYLVFDDTIKNKKFSKYSRSFRRRAKKNSLNPDTPPDNRSPQSSGPWDESQIT